MGNTALMAFISYAQNFEDVMLWRALKHIDSGFYIDIGAWSPDVDSVSRAFYENNWRGINVEPNPRFYLQLLDRRPRDINLCLAVSDTCGELDFNFLSTPGLSTLDDEIAQKHRKAGCSIDRQKVKVATLAEICRSHVPPGQEIHFLKIDVEGMEESVIRGNDWSVFRPWIVVVEATLPMSRQESYATWEHLLLSADYRFAYADGLNRFYVPAEHSELANTLIYPPNVFDEFVLSAQLRAEARAEEAEARAHLAEARTEKAEVKAQQHFDLLQQIYSTRSWRLTAPLRWMFSRVVQFSNHTFTASGRELTNKVFHSLLTRLVAFVDARPRLHLLCVKMLRALGIFHVVLPAYVRVKEQQNALNTGKEGQCQCVFPQGVRQLTPRARRICEDLEAAIAAKHRESS